MKGSIADLIFISLSFVILFIFVGVVFYTNSVFFKNVLPILNTTKTNEIAPKVESFGNVVFSLIPYAWILLNVGALISAFFIAVHPVFLIAGIILTALNIIVSYLFQQIILEFLPILPELELATANNFLLNFIVSNFPLAVAIINALIIILMVVRYASEVSI